MTQVIPFRPPSEEPDHDPPPQRQELSRVRRELGKAAASAPDRRRVADSAKWWATDGLKGAFWLGLKGPLVALLELKLALIGFGRVVRAWSRWMAAAEFSERAAKGESGELGKFAEKIERTKSGRRKLSLIAFLLLVAVVWWATVKYPDYLAVTGLLFFGLCNLIGRSGREKPEEKLVAFPRSPIGAGMPLSSLRASLGEILEFEGFDPDETVVDLPHPIVNGWRVPYHSRKAIEDTHLRALERALQIRRHGITQTRDPENSARGELWVSIVDPLAEVIPSPEIPPTTVYELQGLGRNGNGGEWVEHFLRAHFVAVGASQSGKSSLFWQIIYVLRRCVDVEMDAIDLTDGPCFSACHRAFRRRAKDEAGAKAILEDAVRLIKQRAAELSRLAEDDDTPDEFDEKHQPTPERPQRVVLIDEGARVTENKDLLALVEYILRYGAKAAVVLGLAGQGGQLDDFGSATVRAQAMLKVLLACSRQDVLSIFGKDARDNGFRPDLLEPAQGEEIRDAGKAFVQSATNSTPEMRRAYRLEQAEVRRRDREIGYRKASDHEDVIDVREIPPMLAAADRAFADLGNPDWAPTSELLPRIQDEGFPELTENGLATGLGLGEDARARRRIDGKGNPKAGYWLASIREAIEG